MAPRPATDPLQPPAQLHGREVELAALRLALGEGGARCLIVRGPGGAGKTALMQRVLAEAREAGSLTGTGKHAQGQAARDLDPLMCALEEALNAGLDQLFDPMAGVEDLRRALGDNAPVLAALGAGVLRTLAPARTLGPLTAERADERLIQAVIRALRWLEGFGAPVLLLIDDWGRAGPQAQRLYARILAEPALTLTRLLATERDEEQFSAPPAAAAVVELGPLSPTAQLVLARELLGARAGAAEGVVGFLGPAAGMPFDLVSSVRILAPTALALSGGRWRLDAVRARHALAGSAAPSLVRQAAELEPRAFALARTLAVYGDDADVADLACAAGLEPSEAAAAADALAGLGIVHRDGPKVRYVHDRLRAAVLDGLAPDHRSDCAGALAEALRRSGAAPGQGERGMTMLMRRIEGGLASVDDLAWWRDAFAVGALAARQVGDRAAAEACVHAGLEAARTTGETYELLTEAASAAISRGDHAEACRQADAARGLAATPAEQAAADEMRVFARRVSGDLEAALEVASEVLARVGIVLPRRVTVPNLVRAVSRVFTLDPRKATRPLPPEALAVEAPMIRAMNGIGSLLFEREPLLVVVLVMRFLSVPVIFGTAAGAGTMALIASAFGQYRRAAEWASAADRLQAPGQPLRAIAKQYSMNFGHVFVKPRPETRSRGEEMASLAYAEGDLAVAVYGNRDRVLDSLFSDDSLQEAARLGDEAVRAAERLSDTPTIPHVRALRQMIQQLQDGGPNGWRLHGEHLDGSGSARELETAGLANTARGIAALEALLGVAYGEYGRVAAMADRPWPKFRAAPFQAQTQIWTFATGLALYRTGRRPPGLALWNLRRLARLNPNDFLHRWRLLEAESLRVRGRRRAALKAYAQAVSAACASRCRLEEGLVAAAAAEGAEALDDLAASLTWRATAIAAWRAQGAHGLVETRFGLAPVRASEALESQVAALERQHAEHARELDVARDAAERANRAKSRLLAAVGHELRTPLQGALGLLDLAAGPGETVDVETLRRALIHLAEVVGDLTDLGALEGGVLSVARAPFDAAAAAASVAALHQPTARATGRDLVVEGLSEPLWVAGDEGRVRQVLGNLVANALRHGAGRVTVSVRRLAGATDRLLFQVSDEGAPLSDAEVLRIFEPFDRGGREADNGGLGLGLFLGRHLARAMGGDLRVAASPNGGKAFELEIAAPAAAPAANIRAGRELMGVRVLLAEDTDLSRHVLAELLRREGCYVRAVADGQAAQAALAEDAFDLVLLDQRMPGATGLDVARALAGAGGGRPRCVLMTASLDTALEAQAREAGVDQLLQKPLGIADLRSLAPVIPAAVFRAAGFVGRDGVRAAELRRQLGPEGDALLREVRPAVEIELQALGDAVAAEDAERLEARLHRLRGLARHFGLETLLQSLDCPTPETAEAAEMLSRIREGAAATDWSAFETH
ncbi:ATP-binding protein [Phenylobacterium sp. VNQ135]|uniref:ATP-binding protein n=1 Tax=Phenylobacterium sp. VNQ135 TaxID=3400922 RepID=UPI003C0E9222